MMLNEIKRIEPYIIEENRVVSLEFVKRSATELKKHFTFQIPPLPELTFYHVKLVLTNPEELDEAVRGQEISTDRQTYLKSKFFL